MVFIYLKSLKTYRRIIASEQANKKPEDQRSFVHLLPQNDWDPDRYLSD